MHTPVIPKQSLSVQDPTWFAHLLQGLEGAVSLGLYHEAVEVDEPAIVSASAANSFGIGGLDEDA